jgi:hypothetical protein
MLTVSQLEERLAALPFLEKLKAHYYDVSGNGAHFEYDLLEHTGTTGKPLSRLAFRMATHQGASNGFSGIAEHYIQLVDLINEGVELMEEHKKRVTSDKWSTLSNYLSALMGEVRSNYL